MTSPFTFIEAATSDEYIGARIDLIRRAKRLKQSELALAAGLNRVSLNRKINGSQPWSFAEVVRIANALGVSLMDITEGVERLEYTPSDSNREPADYVPVAAWALRCPNCGDDDYSGGWCANCDYGLTDVGVVVDLTAWRSLRSAS
jgi:DNA-binding phage protein